jgi:hypothetical protein
MLRRHVELRFERWVLFAVVAVLSISWGALALYVLTEGTRNCEVINRSNIGNRAAWAFMEQTVAASWLEKPPPVEQRVATAQFFAGIDQRLKPIDC